ncbi:hypothetical protein CLV51_103694 [Chitinophaga niastensis]|uniref:Uncharacterized protein n=1 Tax=Chitinophaga niastensis TaxID=536980 RepID=A0A2P8HKH1_CHINA|nr:hypothetical protein [Chitinophaga niastensis]PSL46713.1 hypothetical protein CLV51_103694 [Chitinophaga niastensis]
MSYMNWICCCFLSLVCSIPLKGQSVENMDKAIEILDKVSKSYGAGELSFDLNYTYANEHQPGVLLDSLHGSMQLSQGNYRSAIGNTILLKNSHYNIAVFKEDKLIHVSKPMLSDSLDASPLGMIAASIRQAGIKTCQITRKGDITQIHFTFPPDNVYKYMEIKLDNKNWHINQLQFVIKSSMLSESGQVAGEGYEAYALVKASFYHYKTGHTDPAIFNENQFFTRKADTLIPAPAYEDYEVFIGTPNI